MKQEPVIEKDLTPEEVLSKAMEFLDESRFNFACFVDEMKRWHERSKSKHL